MRRTAFLVAVLAAANGPIMAADWNASRQLTVRGSYTDNLKLEDSDTEDAFFVEFVPGIVFTGRGRRLELDLAYSLQYINYLVSDESDRFNNRLQANGRAELYKDHLFLDTRISVRQNLIDPLGPAGGDAANVTDNLQTTASYSIAPSYINRFGGYATFAVRFVNDGVLYEEEGDGSIGYGTSVELLSGPRFGNLSWGVIGDYRLVQYEDSPDDRFRSIAGLLGYELNERWRVDGSVGYDDDEFESFSETSGEFWTASLTWTPTPRTSLRLGTGERYFGSVPTMDFSHRWKRSVLTASYVRDRATARTDRLESDVFVFEDAFGEPIIPETGVSEDVPVDSARPTSSVFISDRFRATYTIATRRSTVGGAVGYTMREYEDSNDETTTWTARLFGSRRLTGLTTARIGLSWDRREETDAPGTDEEERMDTTFDVGLSRRLSPRSNIDFGYRFRDGDDYTENRITAAFRTTWD